MSAMKDRRRWRTFAEELEEVRRRHVAKETTADNLWAWRSRAAASSATFGLGILEG
jgi:hypothetical protein